MNARIEVLEAETPEWLRPYVSRESYIDSAIAQLIQKGWDNLSDSERQEYLNLVDARVNLMIPESLLQFRRLRDSRSEENSWASTRKSKRWWQSGWQTMVAFLNTSKTRLTTWWRNAPDA